MEDLTARVLEAGRAAGLVAVGVCSAEPFDDVRVQLEERRAAGLSSTMQFTYRNPARSTDPARALPGAQALIAGAWPVPNTPVHTSVARYAWRDHYAELRAALERSAEVLRAEGYDARVLCDDNALVDRAVAVRAGLGWYGKNANVLVPGHGSWVVLGSVVTTAPLVTAAAPVADGCGGCTRCIDGCPTGAIVAPGVVDARRCLAWLVQQAGTFPVEFRAALGDRIYGCDDCQEVCPPSRRVTHDGAPPRTVDLVSILDASDEELLRDYGTWYIAKRDPRYLKRNALIALGNRLGNIDDPAARAVLERFAQGDDAMLAEHAQWALSA